MEMHAALLSGDPFGDGRHILKLRLHISVPSCKFSGFQRVAGVQLVGDNQRHNAQFGQHGFGVLPPIPRQGQHFDDRGFCYIAAILCPPLAVGDPHRLPVVTDRVSDVTCQTFRCRQQRSWAIHIALDHKALIQAHEVRHPGLGEQIIADGHRERFGTRSMEGVIGVSRVHDDVAVVTQENAGLTKI